MGKVTGCSLFPLCVHRMDQGHPGLCQDGGYTTHLPGSISNDPLLGQTSQDHLCCKREIVLGTSETSWGPLCLGEDTGKS